jgi:5-methylcytosine-specific restriction protein A
MTAVTDQRVRGGQSIPFRLPSGQPVVSRVKLCWRRNESDRGGERLESYSATQLIARIKDDDWIGPLQRKIDREKSAGTTHFLIAQRDGKRFPLAALVPLGAVLPIWEIQRDISNELIAAGAIGTRKKNHAMNGHSPTLWLQDDRGGERVAEALWTYAGVMDVSADAKDAASFHGPDEVREPSLFLEGSTRRVSVNAYERDRRARRECIKHHGATCAVCGFQFGDAYGPVAQGHIHVHHLRPLAAAGGECVVNPVTDLRPVCANCHSVIHLGGVLRSIEEVQSLLAKNRREPA